MENLRRVILGFGPARRGSHCGEVMLGAALGLGLLSHCGEVMIGAAGGMYQWRQGLVRAPQPYSPNSNPNLRHRHQHQWLLFLDTDEYLHLDPMGTRHYFGSQGLSTHVDTPSVQQRSWLDPTYGCTSGA